MYIHVCSEQKPYVHIYIHTHTPATKQLLTSINEELDEVCVCMYIHAYTRTDLVLFFFHLLICMHRHMLAICMLFRHLITRWEFPKIRGPHIDPKSVGLLL